MVSLGSGAALLATIITGISLQLSLLFAIAIWVGVGALLWARAGQEARRRLVRTALAGAAAGFTATLLYDASRWAFSHLDPAPYNPFEAVRVFGVLLTGSMPEAGDAGVMTVGVLFHLLNGTTFGVAYALLLGRSRAGVAWALATGIAWGVGLEVFQLTFYPGWLDVRAYEEFVRVSFLGHLVYGATVGLGTRYLLRRLDGARRQRGVRD